MSTFRRTWFPSRAFSPACPVLQGSQCRGLAGGARSRLSTGTSPGCTSRCPKRLWAVNAYLRKWTSGFDARPFQIFIEPLAAPNQIQTRSYGYEFTVVTTPSAEPRIFDIRHALPALPARSAVHARAGDSEPQEDPGRPRPAGAPRWSDAFKDDFLLLTTESLIKAIEARLDHKPEAPSKPRQGFILTPFFAEQLPVYEKQEEAMKSLLPRHGEGHRPGEGRRPADQRGVRQRSVRPRPGTGGGAAAGSAADGRGRRWTTPTALCGARRRGNLEKAKKLYLDAFRADRRTARASRGLLRAGAHRGFSRKIPTRPSSFSTRPWSRGRSRQVKAWVLVYLGRLSLAAGDGDQAAVHFQAGLEGGWRVATAARKAAAEAANSIRNSEQTLKEF